MVVAVGLVPTLLWRRTRPLLMVAIAFGVTGLAPLLTGGEPLEPVHDGVRADPGVRAVPVGFRARGRDRLGDRARQASASRWSSASSTLADAIGGFDRAVRGHRPGRGVAVPGRARTRELDQVKLLERERLARDLHDTVAHHVSAMAIRAQAGLATAATHPDAAADALRVIEAEASRALAEMRAMVRVLRRDEPADLAPSPRIADLEQLAEPTARRPAGRRGARRRPRRPPPSVGAAIYRLAQESVTNARRHARHATRIEVRVAADDTSVRLRVSDDGDASAVRAGRRRATGSSA